MKKLLYLFIAIIGCIHLYACRSDEQIREDAIRYIMNTKIADMSSYEVVETHYRDSVMDKPIDYEMVLLALSTKDSLMSLCASMNAFQNQLRHNGRDGRFAVNCDSLDEQEIFLLINYYNDVISLCRSYQRLIDLSNAKERAHIKRVRQKYRYKNSSGEIVFGVGYFFFTNEEEPPKYVLTDESGAECSDYFISGALLNNYDWLSIFINKLGVDGFSPNVLRALAKTEGQITRENLSSSGFTIPSSNSVMTKQPLANYTINSRNESELNGLQKVSFVVVIPNEYDKNTLDEISDYLKNQESIPYVFVEYYLSTQPLNGGNYAISKRTPQEISTTINYQASPKDEITNNSPYKGCKVYGKWSMYGATLIVYQKNGRTYMVNYYGGNSYGDEELYIKTTYRGRTAFVNAEDPDDMYVINSYGDLDGYNMGDLAITFSRIE